MDQKNNSDSPNPSESEKQTIKKALKESIHLPQTPFPMKAHLGQKEPQYVEQWDKSSLYQALVEKNKGQTPFVMADGPPYANGHLHMGHVLNKCLKDFVIKYKNMAGFHAPFTPGWDCHGLPIEHNVTKNAKKTGDLNSREIRSLCRKEAQKWVHLQKQEFMRLGILADWERPYLTLNPSYEAEEVREFARIYKKGLIVRGEKPVYWCVPLQTALAEAEIEYKNHTSPSIYVKFPYKPSSHLGQFDGPVFATIWTTTPWTLPANQALALNKNFSYGFFPCKGEFFLLAQDMREKFEKATGLELTPPSQYFRGSEFEGEKAQNPLMERPSPFVFGQHVNLEEGTGLVHTAPDHGPEDYQVGLEQGLKPLNLVKPNGTYAPEVPVYGGLHIFKANEPIIEDLKQSQRLLARKDINHSYPHCWRSGSPLIFRTTPQWFIPMDAPHYKLRHKALESMKDISFVPHWGHKRLKAMIENRPDWCISRQRNWGVPLPILYCENCGHPLTHLEVMEKIASAMEKGEGIEAYYNSPVQEFTQGQSCEKCGSSQFRKGKDILDVWFDSGVYHATVHKKTKELPFPADIYLEGSDQHRGWFQTSLLTSLASSNTKPFQTLVTHNFVNDEKGHKMSKKWGNAVQPSQLIKESGAEILRLWVASQDYSQDIQYSQQSINRVIETYRRLRNTMRFLLGNINDFSFQTDQVNYENLSPLDQWMLDRFYQWSWEVEKNYENFQFYKIYQALNQFFTVDLSAHYLDMVKDRLYTGKARGILRRSCQSVLSLLTQDLMSIMAPLTSFLSEEVHSHWNQKTKSSVFLTNYPKPLEIWKNLKIRTDFDQMFQLRAQVTALIEEERRQKTLGSSLEAQVIMELPEDLYNLAQTYEQIWCEFLIVSQVKIEKKNSLKLTVLPCPGAKVSSLLEFWNSHSH